jgi:hypothetical protein
MGFEVTHADQQFANTINLSRHQKAFEVVNEEGETGTFVFHRPTLGDELKVAALATSYLSLPEIAGPDAGKMPDHLSANVQGVAVMLAQLNVGCDMRPDWMPKDFRQSCDDALVTELYERFEEWVNSFRGRIPGAGGADRGAADAADPGVAVGVVESPAV